MLSLRTYFAIRARDHHHITVRIAEPYFFVLGCRVNPRFLNHFSPQLSRSIYRRVKVADLEPKQDAVPMRGGLRVHKIWMVFFIPGVKLKN